MPNTTSSEPARHCIQCGADLRTDAKFCTTCGTPVQPVSQPAAPASRQQNAPSPQKGFRWLLLGAVLLAVAAVATLFLVNRTPPAAPSVPVAASPTVAQDIPYPDVARVTADAAHISAMSGAAIIVDVRDKQSYDQSHARGAVSIPLDELATRMGELPQDKAIITYCT